jgi:hypothetical protein
MKFNNSYRIHFGKIHLCVSKSDYTLFNASKGTKEYGTVCERLIKKYCTIKD